mgnify:CR=1 FL=1
MNNFVKLDIAIELLSSKISEVSNLYKITNDEEHGETLNHLLNEREEMYEGNIDVINKIIDTYGEENNNNFFKEL